MQITNDCVKMQTSHLPQTVSNCDMRSLAMVCEFGVKDKPEIKMGGLWISVLDLPVSASHSISLDFSYFTYKMKVTVISAGTLTPNCRLESCV